MRSGHTGHRIPPGPPGPPGPPPSQPPPAPARAIVHQVPATQMTMRSYLLDFHKAGRPDGGAVKYTSLRAVDGDDYTQMWARTPRKGGYLEVTLHNVRGAIARIELVEHDADFCKAGQVTIGKRRFAFKPGPGESIDIMPPELVQSFRIEVVQTQVVWWQLFEVRVYTTAKTADPPPEEARRHLQGDGVGGNQGSVNRQPKVTKLDPQRSTKDSATQPVPAPVPPAPPPPSIEPVCAPTCTAGHGVCVLNPAYVAGNKPRHGSPQPSGICECQPGYAGSACDLPVCAGCDPDKGTCVGPGVCNCKSGWSGKACTMRGEVLYGTSMSFHSVRAPKELLHATAGGTRATDGTRMAVVASSDKQLAETASAGGAWWQVLGPPGTSDEFLRGEIITDGSIIRLRHHVSGRNLQVDHSTPAAVRRDLKQVSLSAEQDGTKEAFYVLVDRRHERSKPSARAWGVGSEVVLVHCKSGYVLASSGEKLATRVGEGHPWRMESEVHAQAHIPNAQGQFWSISKYELPQHRPPVSLTSNSIVRLVAPPVDGVQPVAHGQLSDTCYLAALGGSDGGIDCVRSTQGHELWVMLPRKEETGRRSVAGETPALRTEREAAERNGTLVHTSRFTLLHAASMGTLQVVRKQDGKKTVGVGGPLPDNDQADCLSVSLGASETAARPWVNNAAASLHFCGTRLSLSLGNKVGTWIPEVVEKLPSDAGDDDIAAALGELSMKGGFFTVAAQQYSRALEKRALRSSEGSPRAVPTHILHFKRAIVRTHTGQNAAAIWDLGQSIRLEPNFLEALLYRSRILLTLGRWKEASKGFKHIARSSKAKEVLVYRAKQYQSMIHTVSNTLEKAEEAITVAKDAYSGDTGARCRMSAEDRGVLLWARERLTDVLSVAPESVVVRRLRAETSLLVNDLPAVKADATWAIRLDGSNPQGHFLRAQSHHLAMDDDVASEFYRWCLKLDHDHVGCRLGIKSMKAMAAMYTYANLKFRLGDFEGALAEYATGIELAPGHCALVALMHLQRCRCFIYMNEPKTAQGECAISYTIDPSLEDAEYLMKNAVQIASNYQRILEEEKHVQEEEQKKQEAEQAKQRRMQEELQMNATNVTVYRKEWMTDEDKMEAQLKNLPICDQYFFRLNMTNSTHPKAGPQTSTNDVKRAYRKASMIWHPDKHKSQAGKARAEKKFQQIVVAYELLSDEKQLQLCLKGEEPTKQQDAQKDQQPPEPPKPGRPPEEPAPQEPPISAHLAWSQHLGVGGLLSSQTHQRTVSADGIHAEVLYSLTIDLKDRSGGVEFRATGLSAWGSPDHTLRCDFEHQEDTEAEKSNKYEVRDEYGQATAGDRRSQSNTGHNFGENLDVPVSGSLSLQFAAPLGSVLDEDKRHIDIEFQEYQVSDLLKLEDGAKGLVDLRFTLDNREGNVYIFLAVSRYTKSTGQPALRLDGLTVNFEPGYWIKKKSIARKRKVAPMNGLESAGGSSMHNAFDGDLSTHFKSAQPLIKDQAMVVDLDMIYQLSKIEVKEQMGHECVACSIEISCDQKKWWPVHVFTAGVGEVVEWKTHAAEEQDSMGFIVQGAVPKLILARFVRIVATAPTPGTHLASTTTVISGTAINHLHGASTLSLLLLQPRRRHKTRTASLDTLAWLGTCRKWMYLVKS